MKKFAIHDRVSCINIGGKLVYSVYGDKPSYGIITDILSDGRVMVQWDDRMARKSTPIDPQNLISELEMQKKYSELELAFHKVERDVRDKMTEASQLILDAQKIAKMAGFDLQELSDATSLLENAMDEAGWQTSSWHC